MSKRCINLFKFSDIISGGVYVIAILFTLLSFFVPHIMLVMAAIVHNLYLGDWGYLYFVAFIVLNYFTFKHKAAALIGHIIMILILALTGSGVSYLYIALFFIYLLPYLCVYREAVYLASDK